MIILGIPAFYGHSIRGWGKGRSKAAAKRRRARRKAFIEFIAEAAKAGFYARKSR